MPSDIEIHELSENCSFWVTRSLIQRFKICLLIIVTSCTLSLRMTIDIIHSIVHKNYYTMRTEQLISIADNLKLVNEQTQRAAQKAGRQASEITLLAVSKFASVEKIVAAYQCGQHFFGESRIQESQAKIESLRDRLPEAKWSLIGHLQSNKAVKAIELFDQVQSVDSLKIAEKLSEQASKANRTLEVLLEVNSSGEKQKYGVSFSEAPELAEQISNLKSISLAGLMTIGPHTEDEVTIRKAFAETRTLFDSLNSFFVRSSVVESGAAEALGQEPINQKTMGQKAIGQLSMGMSADFELAIAEGSTEIRIGTSIFGPRDSKLRT